ncbi:unnamed protein product [Linum tenue]|uniref:Senescence regulator n=1 Tax=Linum tenue TaxID=586396 RepID=A0AAV0LPC2_9ROSI|nr:unnamed protein product [Linum tenue]
MLQEIRRMGGRHDSDWQGNGVWRSLRDGDYDEQDVWDVLRHNSKTNSIQQHSAPLPYRNFPSAARMIPIGGGGSSDNEAKLLVQQSAPVNIPDWSKIRGKNQPSKSSKKPWMGSDDDDGEREDEEGDEMDGGDDSHMEPPHEMISRRMARTQISSFSVLEGVGRKLKGRDLSKVRNAILTRTGFLESR